MRRRTRRTLAEGLVAGILGYLVIALFFAGWNLVAGRSPFYTPALLGEALFYGLQHPNELSTIEPGPVFALNFVHLALLLAIGMAVAWIVAAGERIPQFWYLSALALTFIAVKTFGIVIFITETVRSALPFLGVILASALAASVMGLYLVSRHPGLRDGMQA